MNVLTKYINSFLQLFYPNLCLACGNELPHGKEIICISCQYYLPKTNFHKEKENPFTERFWGRVKIESAASLYFFTKGGRTQELIHNLKYNGKKEIGVKLGGVYGSMLNKSPHFESVDCIIPVPLHPKKERIRGFNQSTVFAQGLSKSMEIPFYNNVLIRNTNTKTQTKKSRLDRVANVGDKFQIKNPKKILDKHVMIVDDVVTTGATLEACAVNFEGLDGVKISLVTIAIAI